MAPLQFNPDRFVELLSFTATVCGTWVAAGLLAGGYRIDSTADLNTALARTCRIWLVSMPVSAAQLVLVTAVEGQSLVGAEGFATVLPLAASGPGEPFATAAGVLGLMACWRAFYTAYLDVFNLRSAAGNLVDRGQQVQHFVETLRTVLLLCIACCVVLQFLGGVVGEEQLEDLALSLSRALPEMWRGSM